jgi:hypothetical protein
MYGRAELPWHTRDMVLQSGMVYTRQYQHWGFTSHAVRTQDAP